MSANPIIESEAIARHARRSLWLAIIILLTLGGFAALAIVAASTLAWRDSATWAGSLVTIGILMTVAVLGKAPASRRAMASLQDDELRRQSVSRAQRDALLAVLAVQPVVALALTYFGADSPAALMACSTVVLGGVAFLGGILWRDR